VFYLEHRLSNDLDFFTTQRNIEWVPIEKLIQFVGHTIKAEIRSIQLTPYFRRYELTRGHEREIVDLVVEETPQIDQEKNQFGPVVVDTLREIGVNKICTLLGRFEVKDLIDLYFLEKGGFDILTNLSLAEKKEGGLDPAVLSHLLSQYSSLEIPLYLQLKPLAPQDLSHFVDSLRRRFAEKAFPE